jgi:hypothetical protein
VVCRGISCPSWDLLLLSSSFQTSVCLLFTRFVSCFLLPRCIHSFSLCSFSCPLFTSIVLSSMYTSYLSTLAHLRFVISSKTVHLFIKISYFASKDLPLTCPCSDQFIRGNLSISFLLHMPGAHPPTGVGLEKNRSHRLGQTPSGRPRARLSGLETRIWQYIMSWKQRPKHIRCVY